MTLKVISSLLQFIFFIADSHARSFVDGYVKVPRGSLSFGWMSTPGASAAQLAREVQGAVVTREPDAVCVLAPSNNLTASKTIAEAGADFAKLLLAVCERWPKVRQDFIFDCIVNTISTR